MADLFSQNSLYIDFDSPFFTSQLITYIGNKRALLPFLNYGFEVVKSKLEKQKISVLDGFSGSGVVSRLLKYHSKKLYTNDLESYSYVCNKCFLSNKSQIDVKKINKTIDLLNSQKNNLIEGFITKNYSPKDDNDIKMGERVFYTHKNGMILDTFKKWIYSNIPQKEQCFYLAPLIVEGSIHTNTSGVFKGFHKKDGIGHFGGSGENALKRIMGEITIKRPVFSDVECEIEVSQQAINQLVRELPELDLAYYDPPYNQHPYGSNYFMLNILSTPKEEISIQDGVSGISVDWNRSNYNKKQSAIESMDDLVKNTKAKFILISYNNEGIIPFDTFKSILEKYGKVELLQQDYNTYRGCRNLHDRSIKVKELLWVLEKNG